MRSAILSANLERAARSARSALTLFAAAMAVLFSVHISACLAACDHHHHSTASLIRAAQADFLSAYNGPGRDITAAANGGSNVVAVLPASQQNLTVPAAIARDTSSAFPLANMRNTALYHHAVTVLLI